MCLTIPGEVRRIHGADEPQRTAEVDFDGVVRTVRLLYLPETRVGDFVMVHAGFATRRVTPSDARESWQAARALRGEAPVVPEVPCPPTLAPPLASSDRAARQPGSTNP